MEKLEIKEIEILQNFDDILTFKEFKTALKIGRNKAYKLLQDGTIPCKRIGIEYRIPKANVINYLKSL